MKIYSLILLHLKIKNNIKLKIKIKKYKINFIWKNNDYEWKPCALVIFIMSLSVRLSEWIYLRYTYPKLSKICHFHKCEMNDLAIHYWGAMIHSVFFNIERWSSTSRWLFLSQFEYDQAQMVGFVDNYENSNCVLSPTGRRSEMMKKTKPIFSKSHHKKCWKTNCLKDRHSSRVFL